MRQNAEGNLTFVAASAGELSGAIKRLLGCYPNARPADAQVYIAAITGVLAQYPDQIVNAVTDPVRGLPRRLKFLPTVAELAEALDAEIKPYREEYREIEAREKRRAELLASPQPDPEARARVTAQIYQLSDRLRRAPEAVRELQKKAWEAQGERIKRVIAEAKSIKGAHD